MAQLFQEPLKALRKFIVFGESVPGVLCPSRKACFRSNLNDFFKNRKKPQNPTYRNLIMCRSKVQTCTPNYKNTITPTLFCNQFLLLDSPGNFLFLWKPLLMASCFRQYGIWGWLTCKFLSKIITKNNQKLCFIRYNSQNEIEINSEKENREKEKLRKNMKKNKEEEF